MACVVTDKCMNCDGVKYCVSSCAYECLFDAGTQVVIDVENCVSCRTCLQCKNEAIVDDHNATESQIEFNVMKVAELKKSGAEVLR